MTKKLSCPTKSLKYLKDISMWYRILESTIRYLRKQREQIPHKKIFNLCNQIFFVYEKFAEYVLKLPPTPPSVRGSGRPFILMALMALRWW